MSAGRACSLLWCLPGSADESVSDGGPAGLIWRQFDPDGFYLLGVEFAQGGVEDSGIFLRVRWHFDELVATSRELAHCGCKQVTGNQCGVQRTQQHHGARLV